MLVASPKIQSDVANLCLRTQQIMGAFNRTVFGCPSCGARVSGYELACPRCGAIFTEETKFECPFCASLVPRSSKTCPSCQIELVLPEQKPLEATLDELFDQIMKSEAQEGGIKRKRFGCPNCSFLLTGDEKQCPKCSCDFVKANKVECPICGALIPWTSKSCPECDRVLADLSELADFTTEEVREGARRADTEIRFPELEQVGAGQEPTEPTTVCEGTAADAQSVLETLCPVCGHYVPADVSKCPHCGTEFEPFGEEQPSNDSSESINAADEADQALDALLKTMRRMEQSKPKKKRQLKAATTKMPDLVGKEGPGRLGKVNGTGFINGRRAGYDSGATNGTGLVNGSGAVNGLGATNGVSLVNGMGISNGRRANGHVQPKGVSRHGILDHWRILAFLVALMIVIPSLLLLSSQEPSDSYVVDGDFGEWAGAQSYPALRASASATINLEEWSVAFSGDDLFYYLKTESSVMAGPRVENICIFIDSDSDSTTGYAVGSIGADYRVMLEGWNGSVRSSSVHLYGSGSDQHDWNSWLEAGSSQCVLSGAQVEGRARLGEVASANPKVLIVSKDEAENLCFSAPVPVGGRLLIVGQTPGLDVTDSGIVGLGTDIQFLSLTLLALGGSGTVSALTPTVSGCEPVSSFTAREIRIGVPATYDVIVDTSAHSEGQLVYAVVSEEEVESNFDSVLVIGSGARAYLTSPPENVVIDGAFADWHGRTYQDSDLVPVQNANIDIQETGASNTSLSAFFFVSVRGEMCSGAYVPKACAKPISGGGGTYIPKRKTAEDLTRVYVDTDYSQNTGLDVAYSSKSIGADMMIEVRGLFGRITSSTMFKYQSGSWVESGAPVEAANDVRRLEVGIALSDLGSEGAIDFIFETTSWSGRSDLAEFVPGILSTYSLSNGMLGTRAWPIDSSVTLTTATAMSYQRKIFHDGTNFWSFYSDGSDTVYKYSADNGATWTFVGAPFNTAGVDLVSIWYDSANNIVYAVGDTSEATIYVTLQRGTVTPSTHTISWASGEDETLAVSDNPKSRKHTFISKDASGYVWVMSSNLTDTAPTPLYGLAVFRSTSTDSITSFVHSGNMLSTSVTGYNVKGSVLPAGSGSDMWAVYGYMGNVAARKYTGAWSAETVIYNIGSGNLANTYYAPPCALVDGNGVIHVVYGNGHEQPSIPKPFIYYVYNTGSSWSVPYRLDSVANPYGNLYPTISLDSSTGDVYAFWIETGTDGVGTTIMGKKNVSGTWSALTVDPQTTYPKQFLTSIYSASDSDYICWQWTQNTSYPIQVIFDKIPEFGDVLIPTGFMVFAIVFIARRRRGVREHVKG
ncbi:MAG: hypothetical protein JW880_07945 [Candidatus Thermoplasmatota archaeon]|nr:hypothetical protein [Candidatus Thermoplasmatota archaeon]